MINAKQYQETQDGLLLAVAELRTLPLEEFVKVTEEIEAAGLTTAPADYRAAVDRLARIRALARGAADLVRIYKSDPSLVDLVNEAWMRQARAEGKANAEAKARVEGRAEGRAEQTPQTRPMEA